MDVFKINHVIIIGVSGSFDLDQNQRIVGSSFGPKLFTNVISNSIKAFSTYCKFEH